MSEQLMHSMIAQDKSRRRAPAPALSVLLTLTLAASSSLAFGAPAPGPLQAGTQHDVAATLLTGAASAQVSTGAVRPGGTAGPSAEDLKSAERLLDPRPSRRVEAQLPDISAPVAPPAEAASAEVLGKRLHGLRG